MLDSEEWRARVLASESPSVRGVAGRCQRSPARGEGRTETYQKKAKSQMSQNSSEDRAPVETFSMDQATAMFRGGLIDDFTVMRVNGAWTLALMIAGGKQVTPLRTAEPGCYEPCSFLTLDDAILAAHQIGFDTRSLGIWRPLGPQVARMMAGAK